MKILISSILRRLSSLIEIDDTPSDVDMRQKRMMVRKKNPVGTPPGEVTKPSVPDPQIGVVVEKQNEYAAPPQIRRPRREHEHQKKWNDDSKTGLMKEYMQGYRADGKDLETSSPKSKYVKKPRI